MLESRAAERSRRLEDAVGNQLFNNGVKQILAWVDNTKSNLNTNENVRDVQTAEELLNQHAEIGDDIRAYQEPHLINSENYLDRFFAYIFFQCQNFAENQMFS